MLQIVHIEMKPAVLKGRLCVVLWCVCVSSGRWTLIRAQCFTGSGWQASDEIPQASLRLCSYSPPKSAHFLYSTTSRAFSQHWCWWETIRWFQLCEAFMLKSSFSTVRCAVNICTIFLPPMSANIRLIDLCAPALQGFLHVWRRWGARGNRDHIHTIWRFLIVPIETLSEGSDYSESSARRNQQKGLKGSYDAISSVSFSLKCYKLFMHT